MNLAITNMCVVEHSMGMALLIYPIKDFRDKTKSIRIIDTYIVQRCLYDVCFLIRNTVS